MADYLVGLKRFISAGTQWRRKLRAMPWTRSARATARERIKELEDKITTVVIRNDELEKPRIEIDKRHRKELQEIELRARQAEESLEDAQDRIRELELQCKKCRCPDFIKNADKNLEIICKAIKVPDDEV